MLREHLEEMQDLAAIHEEEAEKSTRDVVNGANFQEDGHVNMDEYLDDVTNNKYGYSEDDSEFIEQRVLLKERIRYPEWGTDYEPYRFEDRGLSEKFRVGRHEDEFAEVALKLKAK